MRTLRTAFLAQWLSSSRRELAWAAFDIAFFLGCLLLPVVHTNNDFITALPVMEGMMTSGVSAADVRQALTCVPAIVYITLGLRVLYSATNNAHPDQTFQMDTASLGNQLKGHALAVVSCHTISFQGFGTAGRTSCIPLERLHVCKSDFTGRSACT